MSTFSREHNTFGISGSQDILEGKLESKTELLAIQVKYTSRKGS